MNFDDLAPDRLFRLDVLPAGCSVKMQTRDDKVRFRAVDAAGVVSGWSGWFQHTQGTPIVLTWSAFWDDDSD